MDFLESECLTNILIVVISIIVFVWFVYPMLAKSFSSNEDFDEDFADVNLEVKIPLPIKAVVPEKQLVITQSTLPVVTDTGAVVINKDLTPPRTAIVKPLLGKPILGNSPLLDTQFDNQPLPTVVVPPNSYLLDDGNEGNSGLQNAVCSKSCCGKQWPVPFKMSYDEDACDNDNKYVPSNLTCSNGISSGCMCVNSQQFDQLSNRGGNAS